MDSKERIAMLEEAGRRVMDAGRLVRAAAGGTQYEVIGRRTCDSLTGIAEDADNAYSIRSLMNDLMHDQSEQPVWTRPLVSVKDIDRRDI